jgi:uncharacterized HAD superfamily protein
MAIIESPTTSLEELLKKFNNRMIFGIDVDNCLTDTNPEILKLANEMYHYPNPYYKKVLERPLTEEDITDFDYEKCTPLNEYQVDELFKQMLKKEKYLNLKLLSNVLNVLNRLEKHYYFYFVTARPGDSEEQTFNYFIKNKMEKYHDRIIIDGDKVKIAKDKGITHFIEDREETALNLADNNIIVYLFDYNWNRQKDKSIVKEINKHPNIQRIYKNPLGHWVNLEKLLIC